MVTIVSSKESDYNEFFSEVIDALNEQYKETPKLLVFALPDQETGTSHLSFYGMDSFDMYQAANLIQYEATRYLVMEEQGRIEAESFDDEDYEEDFDEGDLEDESDGEKVR